MSITVEVEFGNMDCSDHICAHEVSFSVRKSQGCENISGVPAKTLMPVGIHYVVREFFGYVKWKFL